MSSHRNDEMLRNGGVDPANQFYRKVFMSGRVLQETDGTPHWVI
jgi:hypothetical protein